jgi:hypothetical protein
MGGVFIVGNRLNGLEQGVKKQSCGLLLARGPQGESNTGSQRLPSMVMHGRHFHC